MTFTWRSRPCGFWDLPLPPMPFSAGAALPRLLAFLAATTLTLSDLVTALLAPAGVYATLIAYEPALIFFGSLIFSEYVPAAPKVAPFLATIFDPFSSATSALPACSGVSASTSDLALPILIVFGAMTPRP